MASLHRLVGQGIVFLATSFFCLSGSTAHARIAHLLHADTPPAWKKASVGNTRLILDSRGSFVSNTNVPKYDAGIKVISFMQTTKTNTYNITEEYDENGLFLKLDSSAIQYFARFRTRVPSAKLLRKSSLVVQGRQAIRLDGQCVIQGAIILFSWLGIDDDKTSWLIEAHYINTTESISEANRLLSSVVILELPRKPEVSSDAHKWSRIKVGSTRVTTTAPDLFRHDPRFTEAHLQGIKNLTSYFCFFNNSEQSFVISQGEMIDDYQLGVNYSVNAFFEHLKSKAKSQECELINRYKTTIDGKNGVMSVVKMNINGLHCIVTYCLFYDKKFVWVAQSFFRADAENREKRIEDTTRFMSSIKIE